MAVPVHVIGGFLGAGKTTTLDALLRGPLAAESVAVVVNDFGESAVDDATLGEHRVAIEEIRGSCVCCTAPEGFMAAVGRLLDEVSPDRILVEPTGLARPADLVDTLRRAPYADRLDLRPLIVLVDPDAWAGPHADQVKDQARSADVLVANRTDRCAPENLAAFDGWAGQLWPGPVLMLHTVRGALTAEALEWPPDVGARAPATGACALHAHHDHLEGWTASTWTWPPDAVFSRRRLLVELDDLADEPGIARLKGLFRTDEGWARLELAGGDRSEAPTAFRRDSRVDVIANGPVDHEAVRDKLGRALLGEVERAQAAESVEVGLPDGSVRRFDRAALAALPGGVADVAPLLPGREGSAARVGALLDAVGAREGLSAVVVAADGYTTPAVPADALRTGLLLHSLDGGPLPSAKGGPLRLMIPGDAGPGGPCANVKAVVRIALRA